MKMPMIQRRFELSVSAEKPDVTVVYLYGYVIESRGWWDDGDCIALNEVRERLLEIGTPEIHLHINSFGGSAFAGIAVHNLLKQHPAKVTAYVDGIAASAASVILMAADRIVMPENTMVMIHRAWTFAYGNADQLRKDAGDLDKLDEAVLASYKKRFVGDEEELKTLLADETWLTAADARALGFCDEVMADVPEPEEPPDKTTGEAGGEPPRNAVLRKYGAALDAGGTVERPKPQISIDKALGAFFDGFDKKKEEGNA
jgi:ATP-dependent protease ClpP protease subunit